MKVEQRIISRPVELRASGDGQPTISGYAAVFYREDDPGTQYRLWAGSFERVMPGAFDEALKRGDDIRGLFNHKPDQVLGRTKSQTMTVTVDEVGLRYEITPSETQLYRDVSEMLRRGDIDGSSFGFSIVGDDHWTRDAEGNDIRELRNVALFDVGPVTFPAYSASTSEARSSWDAIHNGERERERIKRESQLRLTQLALLRK